jgi:SNF2 family DNA or RNA helicase
MEYQFKTLPYQHQLDALKDCANKDNWAFFMDMGTGKTKTTIDNLGILYLKGEIDSALIVAPKSVYSMWETEIQNHLSSQIKTCIQIWNSTKKSKHDLMKQCLDIPPKIYEQRKVQLTGKQKEIYNRLRQHAITILNDSTVSFNNQLTEILRLHQVTNGFVKNDDGVVEEFNNPKLDELMTVLEEINGKAIIWANYIHNIEQIAEAIRKEYGKDSVVTMYGATDVEDRKNVVDLFQNDPNTKFFIGNPTVGGYGLTLHAASYVIYFSNNYNLEVRLQSEDRAHRIGQTKNVLYIDIIAEDTVDEKIVSALDKKLSLSAKTLGEEIKTWLN